DRERADRSNGAPAGPDRRRPRPDPGRDPGHCRHPPCRAGPGQTQGGPPPAAARAEQSPKAAPRQPPPAAHWREYGPLELDPVLSAALEEFVAIGYHGATVRGIAKRCGLSVSGIYHYYTSKQQMLVSLMDFTMIDLLARARAAQA